MTKPPPNETPPLNDDEMTKVDESITPLWLVILFAGGFMIGCLLDVF